MSNKQSLQLDENQVSPVVKTSSEPDFVSVSQFPHLPFWCLVVFLAAFVPRFFIMYQSKPNFSDQYWDIAKSLTFSGDYAIHNPQPQNKLDLSRFFYEQDKPTACRGPITPLYLAMSRLLFGDRVLPVQILSVIMGGFSAVLFFLTLVRTTASPKTAVIGGLIWAFWPPSIYYSTCSFWTEPISQILIITIFYLLSFGSETARIPSIGVGIAFGLAILNRSEFLILVIALSVYSAMALKYHLKSILLANLVCLVIVAPWIMRNYYQLGKATLSTLDGASFYIGNNPFVRGSFSGDFFNITPITDAPSMRWVTDQQPEIWDVGEVRRSELFKKAAFSYLKGILKDDPAHMFWLYKRKFMVFWHAKEDARNQTFPDFLLVQTTLFAFGLTLFLKPSRKKLLFVIPMLSYMIVSLIFYASPRNRFPYESGMIMFMVMQWESLIPQLRSLFISTQA